MIFCSLHNVPKPCPFCNTPPTANAPIYYTTPTFGKAIFHVPTRTHIAADPVQAIKANKETIASLLDLPIKATSEPINMEYKEPMFVSSTGGFRDNSGKIPLSLAPIELEAGAAEVIYAASIPGGGKYPLNNWRKGLPFTGVADSAMRHLKAWVNGEDNDKETKLNHLKHVACNIGFLLNYLNTHPEHDDRYKG